MGLNPGDEIGHPISIDDAYNRVKAWHQANLAKLRGGDEKYRKNSAALIRALPPRSTVTDIEIRAVFQEIIMGLLEWAYHESDGRHKMAAYAWGALKTAGFEPNLNAEELEEITQSRLWPFLEVCKRGQRRGRQQ
jgi:hypothetical protein